jgi:hypothetical protein
MRSACFLLLLALVPVAATGAGTPLARELKTPAGPGSAMPNLHAGADGRVVLSWIEAGGPKRHALRLAVLEGDAWSAPRAIAAGDDWFANWADFPSVVSLGGEAMAAHWLVKNGAETFAYSVHLARSADAGRTWGRPTVPHRDGTETEHGFVSLVPWDGGRIAAVWLDGRQFAKGAGAGEPTEDMTLRFAVVGPDGALTDEALLDGRVCDCCQTSAARTSEGLLVAYRDRSAEEGRDISVVRFAGGRWTKPSSVHNDGWRIAGCPVNGPSVAADGRRVAVAWYTAAGDVARVRVAFSSDAGAAFGTPVEVDDGKPAGRVDALLLGDGSALVSWLERVPDGGEIRVRRISSDGRRGQAVTIAKTSAERASGFPHMARQGDRIVFAWTQPGTPSRVRTATAAVSDLR